MLTNEINQGSSERAEPWLSGAFEAWVGNLWICLRWWLVVDTNSSYSGKMRPVKSHFGPGMWNPTESSGAGLQVIRSAQHWHDLLAVFSECLSRTWWDNVAMVNICLFPHYIFQRWWIPKPWSSHSSCLRFRFIQHQVLDGSKLRDTDRRQCLNDDLLPARMRMLIPSSQLLPTRRWACLPVHTRESYCSHRRWLWPLCSPDFRDH